jgi:hypothetical protein
VELNADDYLELNRLLGEIETDGSYPSASELFHVAGLLACGNKISKSKIIRVQQLHSFAMDAILLWEECSSVRNGMLDKTARSNLFANKALEAARKAQTPTSYPVPFDEFLRLVMPNKRHSDRVKIYRDYIRQKIRVDDWMKRGTFSPQDYLNAPIPSDSEIEEVISKHKASGFSVENYEVSRNYFTRWFSRYTENILSARAKKAAAAKWKQVKPANG